MEQGGRRSRERGKGESIRGGWEIGCLISRLAFSYLGIHFVNIVLASAGCNNEMMAAFMDDAGAH